MARFASYLSYHHFAREVTRVRRYVWSPEQEAFLTALRESAGKRVEEHDLQLPFWRAQHGCDFCAYYQEEHYIGDLPRPFSPARMKPLSDRAREGRANSKGIPVLYGASDRDTAVAETRPWAGAYVSAGVFHTLRGLRLINCTSENPRTELYFSEPSAEEREQAVWNAIDQAFSTPVQAGDDTAAYAPTQVVAEVLRAEGYDGLVFRSSLGPGTNLALFDPESAALVHCEVVRIRGITFTVEPDGGPFSVWRRPEGDTPLQTHEPG